VSWKQFNIFIATARNDAPMMKLQEDIDKLFLAISVMIWEKLTVQDQPQIEFQPVIDQKTPPWEI
jgi:hypothetical protein